MNIGVNFFGPKRKLYHDFEGTITQLKDSGITSAEVCVAFAGNMEPPKEMKLDIPPEVFKEMSGGIWPYEEAEERIKVVRANGLSVISVHMMLGMEPSPEQLVELIPRIVEFGKRNQVQYYVISLMKGLAGMKNYAAALNQMTEELGKVGIKLAYHNHEVECMPEEGTTALDYILEQCPLLKLELDVGWAKFAGASAVELMRKYKDRLELLHFKDIKADASPETRDTCFTAVGEGSIPLKEILTEAKSYPIAEHGIIIDQDDSPTDILVDLAVGAGHIQDAV